MDRLGFRFRSGHVDEFLNELLVESGVMRMAALSSICLHCMRGHANVNFLA